jgi:hypothetical protein
MDDLPISRHRTAVIIIRTVVLAVAYLMVVLKKAVSTTAFTTP